MWSDQGNESAVAIMDTPGCPLQVPHHRPVMLAEVLQWLDPKEGDRALDLTIGTAGHALPIAQRLGQSGLLVGLDADPQVLSIARGRLADTAPCPCQLVHARFSRALEVMRELGLDGFHVVLADLGVGPQLDDPARGFAFESCARLDMRYDPSAGISAWDVVNRTPERALSDILFIYGEERLSRQIAAAICRERQRRPIDTPAELGALIKRVAARRSGGRTWRIHPATRSAMALRIYVNDELGELERLLEVLPSLLAPGGRAAVLSYHSLEARRVKLAWRRQQQEGLIEVLTRKAVKPSEDEIRQNPRARSAQLRVCARPEGNVTCS